MSIPYTRSMAGGLDVDIDADGDININYLDGKHIETVVFTIEELQSILKEAVAHKKAYEMYKESGYENDEGYERTMLFLCGKS